MSSFVRLPRLVALILFLGIPIIQAAEMDSEQSNAATYLDQTNGRDVRICGSSPEGDPLVSAICHRWSPLLPRKREQLLKMETAFSMFGETTEWGIVETSGPLAKRFGPRMYALVMSVYEGGWARVMPRQHLLRKKNEWKTAAAPDHTPEQWVVPTSRLIRPVDSIAVAGGTLQPGDTVCTKTEEYLPQGDAYQVFKVYPNGYVSVRDRDWLQRIFVPANGIAPYLVPADAVGPCQP